MDGIAGDRAAARGATRRRLGSLVLTTFDLDEYVYDALRAGASGFLLKDAPPSELVARRPHRRRRARRCSPPPSPGG